MKGEAKRLHEALKAFARAHGKEDTAGWADHRIRDLKQAKISRVETFARICRSGMTNDGEDRINARLTLYGVPPVNIFAPSTVQAVCAFFPGPTSSSCYELAKEAGDQAKRARKKGDSVNPITKYVHRDKDDEQLDEDIDDDGEEEDEDEDDPSDEGANNDDDDDDDEDEDKEIWIVPEKGNWEEGEWKMHVDCAGFIRRVIRTITMLPIVTALSDRDFMRAKDFFTYFESLEHTVTDVVSSEDDAAAQSGWRRVTDLRHVIAGDVVVYCCRGRAAGGAVFTVGDRKDMTEIFRSVGVAILYNKAMSPEGVVESNMARDESVPDYIEGAKLAFKNAYPKITGAKDMRKLFEETSIDEIKAKLVAYYSNDSSTAVNRYVLTGARSCIEY
jgi:hypothetical protein